MQRFACAAKVTMVFYCLFKSNRMIGCCWPVIISSAMSLTLLVIAQNKQNCYITHIFLNVLSRLCVCIKTDIVHIQEQRQTHDPICHSPFNISLKSIMSEKNPSSMTSFLTPFTCIKAGLYEKCFGIARECIFFCISRITLLLISSLENLISKIYNVLCRI